MEHEGSRRSPAAIRVALLGSIAVLLAAQTQAQAPVTLPEAAPEKPVAAEWRHQKVDLPFAAFTAFYTCTGLEDKMRLILLTLGARPDDLKVRAMCDRAQNQPNKSAWVSVEFSALVPAADPMAPGAVKAAWKNVRLAPNRPHDMGMGECELIEQMGDMVKKGFTFKNLEYHTTCVPKQVSIGDYSVSAQSLQPASTLQAAAH